MKFQIAKYSPKAFVGMLVSVRKFSSRLLELRLGREVDELPNANVRERKRTLGPGNGLPCHNLLRRGWPIN